MQANNVLIELTNSLFGGNKKFELLESYPEYQWPVIKFDSLAPDNWACNAIINTGVVVSDSYINDFITNVEGTYAQIDVASGPLIGKYVISIQTIG